MIGRLLTRPALYWALAAVFWIRVVVLTVLTPRRPDTEGMWEGARAYLTEVFRTGIESVPKGQTEAALSLGLNSRQSMRHIMLPQAIRITIPPFTNYFITLVQDTALLSVLGLIELDHNTFALALPQTDANIKLFVFILGALIYLAICYPLSLLARYLERRMATAY